MSVPKILKDVSNLKKNVKSLENSLLVGDYKELNLSTVLLGEGDVLSNISILPKNWIPLSDDTYFNNNYRIYTSASTPNSDKPLSRAFDGSWRTNSTKSGYLLYEATTGYSYVEISLPEPLCITSFNIGINNNNTRTEGTTPISGVKVLGMDTTWHELSDIIPLDIDTSDIQTILLSTTGSYDRYRLEFFPYTSDTPIESNIYCIETASCVVQYKEHHFSLEVDSFDESQIVLVKTPNYSMTGVLHNTIVTKSSTFHSIDTLLLPDTYYELVYSSEQGIFVARRVA